MSELKVNKISPATGTAFTLGDSGDTFTIPSGATIANSGTATGFVSAGALDLNGAKLTIDANGNTSITSDTDDQIDFEIAGADDFQMTANTFTILSGSTLSAASGVTDGHVLTYTSASDTVGWGAVPSSGDPAGTAVAMAIALGG